MAATVQIIWSRKDRTIAPMPGTTYATVGDANAAIARLKSKNPENQGKTYDVVAVQV